MAGVAQAWLPFTRQPGLRSGLHAICYMVGPRPSAVSGQVKPTGCVGHGPFSPLAMASPESAWSVRNQRGGGNSLESKNRIAGLVCVDELLPGCCLESHNSWLQDTGGYSSAFQSILVLFPRGREAQQRGPLFLLVAFETVWLGGESSRTCGLPWFCFPLTRQPWATSSSVVSLRLLTYQNRGQDLVSVCLVVHQEHKLQ